MTAHPAASPRPPFLWLFDDFSGCWLQFTSPVQVLQTDRIEQVVPVLEQVRQAVETGLFAAGFLSYEAAAAFDPAFATHSQTSFPLAWFGIFNAPKRYYTLPAPTAPFSLGPWKTGLTRSEYLEAIAEIKNRIAAGDTYQVNFTFPLHSRFSGEAFTLFHELHAAQQSRFSAFIQTQEFSICSASPELFFRQEGEQVTTRPMKGTASRGRTYTEDSERKLWLLRSEKNRAENLMIVDMLRNDLGRLAKTGSVQVPSLFAIERYPTVWQMTSEVTARIPQHPVHTLAGLFPCASITGAPKASTMAIIRKLEKNPRRIYTGSIGFFTPDGRARFNVAIRTVLIDNARGLAEYGVGSGVVQDSDPEGEWQECKLKAEVLLRKWPQFSLLETLLWLPRTGYRHLEDHLDRLQNSAHYFGYAFCRRNVTDALLTAGEKFPNEAQKVRLLLNRDGSARIEHSRAPQASPAPVRLALAAEPVQSSDVFLYHKTTHRELYDRARRSRPEADDVILWNEKGQLTETTIANLAVHLDGEWLTPPVSCGLLGGTERMRLLTCGRIREAVLPVEVLERCSAIALFNSVRGWREAELLQPAGPCSS